MKKDQRFQKSKIMLKNTFHYLIIAWVIISNGACSQCTNQNNQNADSISVVSEKTLPPLNDIANFIAGKKVVQQPELTKLCESKEWKEYAAESEIAWKKFENVAKKYRSFAKSEIKAPYATIKTLFYPFSGPDFLFANIVFPDVDKIILIGLESPGSIPQFENLHKDSLRPLLELYKVAIEDVIQLSFFRTVDMKDQLANNSIDGVTPILMLFLARSDKEIVQITSMYLDSTGKPTALDYSQKTEKSNVVEIQYKNKGENKIRSLFYLSTNLADPSLSKDKAFVNFLKNIDNNCLTFIKSATYLMHKSYFSIIRKTCLNHSALILQDDSGIAYKYFDQSKWDIQLYGNYSKPIKLFEEFYEPDLENAFNSSKPKPLKFRFGYNQLSSVLIATKKHNLKH
jgi:hypothetical protein